jgi:DHA2 family multidrug resistance protein-like MFS transporter
MAGGVPAGVPPDAAEAARSTLGGALGVAERLPGPLGAELLGRARDAFVQGVEMVAVVGVAVLVAAAIGAIVALRD